MTENAVTTQDTTGQDTTGQDSTDITEQAPGRDTEDLLEALRDVVDPELGVNVVDLGLIYGLSLAEDNMLTIDMTLTSAACPLTDVIEDQARAALDGLVAGTRQHHRRWPGAAARPRLQPLSGYRGAAGHAPGSKSSSTWRRSPILDRRKSASTSSRPMAGSIAESS